MAIPSRKNNNPKNPKSISLSLPGIRRFSNRNRFSTRFLLHRSLARWLRGRWSIRVVQQILEEEDPQNQKRRIVKKCRLYRKWVRKRSRRDWIRKDGSIGARSELGVSLKAAAAYGKILIKEGFNNNRIGGVSVVKRRSLLIHFSRGRLLGRHLYDGFCPLKVALMGFPPLQVSKRVGSEVDVAKIGVFRGKLIGCRGCLAVTGRGKGGDWRLRSWAWRLGCLSSGKHSWRCDVVFQRSSFGQSQFCWIERRSYGTVGKRWKACIWILLSLCYGNNTGFSFSD